jgi:hypothetical protein
MAKLMYNVNLTAEEVSLLLQLVNNESSYYNNSDDETDVAHYNTCESIADKLYTAS